MFEKNNKKIKIPNKDLIDLWRKVKDNNVFAEHYKTLSEEYNHNKFLKENMKVNPVEF